MPSIFPSGLHAQSTGILSVVTLVWSHQTVLLSQGYSYQELSLPNSHFILSLHIKVDQSGKYCLHVKMISIQTSISRLFSSSVLATRVNKMAHLPFHFGKEIIIIQCNALTSMWALSKIRQKIIIWPFQKEKGGGSVYEIAADYRTENS